MASVIRIAVVEDQALAREVTVERLLARHGAAAAVDAFASVEQMLAAKQDFDVVVLDLWLRGGFSPVRSGRLRRSSWNSACARE